MRLPFLHIVLATTLLGTSMASQSQQVIVGVGNFEPYFIAKGRTGLFTELLDAIFAGIPNYEPVYQFDHSNNRLFQEFREGKLDAVANVFESMDLAPCHTKSFFHFQDMAMTRAEDNLQIHSIEDIKGKSIITFQGAREFLGQTFADQTHAGRYIEMANPGHQVRRLARGQGDVSIGDLFVFLHNLEMVSGLSMKPEDFNYHPVIPKNATRMGFKDKALCERFKVSLDNIEKSGQDKAIYRKYFEKYHAPKKVYELIR